MFSKRQRSYDPDALPPEKRLRANVTDLFTSNAISAERAHEMLRDAAESGVKGMAEFLKPRSTKWKNGNTARRLRNVGNKLSGWPPVYYANIRACKRGSDEELEQVRCAFMLPHEYVATLYKHGDADVISDRSGYDAVSRAHMLSCDAKAGCDLLGVGVWQDGVPCNWDRSVSLEVCSMNLPGAGSGDAKRMRLPCWALLKHQIGANTMHDLMDIIAWSLRCLRLGKYPTERHDGTPFKEKKRLAWAGTPLPTKGILCQIRGDWKMWKEVFGFPQWDKKDGCCARCWIKPDEARL